MTNTAKSNVLKSLTAAVAAPALLLGVAACGDSGEETVNNATEQAGDAASSATEKAGDAVDSAKADESTSTTAAADENSDLSQPKILLDGKPVDGEFAPVKVKRTTDDGQQELKYEAGDGATELEVEILEGDNPTLDGLSLKVDGKEWETSDQQERDAKVVKTGDRYVVSTEVHEDDNEQNTASVKVTFDAKQ